MTKDQIKAIAEKYASKEFEGYPASIAMASTTIFDFLAYLSARYCIVEKEKVEQEYVYACGRSDNGGYYDGRAAILEDLFGTSMFNQNEE